MKNILILIGFLLLFFNSNAQQAVANHQDLEKFMKTTTCIVYDTDIFNTYNSAMETAVKQSWTITPYKFITMDDFKTMKHDSKYSFLVRTKVFSENKSNNVEYTFLSLVLGERDKNFEELPEICSFPLSYYNKDYEKYDYKLGALLIFVQNHIKITFDDQSLNKNNILAYYNKNIQNLGNKTIYLCEDDLATDINSEQKISNYYSGSVKIVDPEDIQELIDNKDEDAIILHLVAPSDNDDSKEKTFKMLVGVSDGLIYYYDAHVISTTKPGKFLKTDFVKLNKK